MASLSRSVTFGSLATLALGACVAATAVPASAQGIARSWGQGGQGMSQDGQNRSWGQGGRGMSQDGQSAFARSWGQGGRGMSQDGRSGFTRSWGQGGRGMSQDGQGMAGSWGQGGQGMAGGCWQNQPIYGDMGNFMGFWPIQVC
jgi:hypothetical protein